MTNHVYPSRVYAWLIVVMIGAVSLVLFQAWLSFDRSSMDGLLSLGILGLMLGIGVAFGYPCEYTLEPQQLLIRSGIIRQRIPYRDITSVEPSRSLWSAPALSLRRVKVSHGRGFCLVSPREPFAEQK
jgi:hypothetical protein